MLSAITGGNWGGIKIILTAVILTAKNGQDNSTRLRSPSANRTYAPKGAKGQICDDETVGLRGWPVPVRDRRDQRVHGIGQMAQGVMLMRRDGDGPDRRDARGAGGAGSCSAGRWGGGAGARYGAVAAATGTRGPGTTTSRCRTSRATSSPGVITVIGPGVRNWSVGDRVTVAVRGGVRPVPVVPFGERAGVPAPAAARLHPLGIIRRAGRAARRRRQPGGHPRGSLVRGRREPGLPVRDRLPGADRACPAGCPGVGDRRRRGRRRTERGDDRQGPRAHR